MAYIIYNQDSANREMSRIAADDAEKAKYPQMLSHTITTDEFNSLKNGTKQITGWDGTNYIFEDVTTPVKEDGTVVPYYKDSSDLQVALTNIIEGINLFLDFAEGHPQSEIDEWTAYKTQLESFDTTSVSYPVSVPWEKYCEDNSITYKSLLQLP